MNDSQLLFVCFIVFIAVACGWLVLRKSRKERVSKSSFIVPRSPGIRANRSVSGATGVGLVNDIEDVADLAIDIAAHDIISSRHIEDEHIRRSSQELDSTLSTSFESSIDDGGGYGSSDDD